VRFVRHASATASGRCEGSREHRAAPVTCRRDGRHGARCVTARTTTLRRGSVPSALPVASRRSRSEPWTRVACSSLSEAGDEPPPYLQDAGEARWLARDAGDELLPYLQNARDAGDELLPYLQSARDAGDELLPTSEAPVKERSAVCEHVRLEASRAVFFMRVSTDAEHRDGATRPSRVRDSVRQVRGESRAPRRTSHVQTRRSPRRPLGRGAHHNAASRVRPLGPAGGFACSSKMAAMPRARNRRPACRRRHACELCVLLDEVLRAREARGLARSVRDACEHGRRAPRRCGSSVTRRRQRPAGSRGVASTAPHQSRADATVATAPAGSRRAPRRSRRRLLGRGAHHDGRDGACWVAARNHNRTSRAHACEHGPRAPLSGVGGA
jgi:hypothetical protein